MTETRSTYTVVISPSVTPPTFELDAANNTHVTRLHNGDWFNSSTESTFSAGSYTANFYENLYRRELAEWATAWLDRTNSRRTGGLKAAMERMSAEQAAEINSHCNED